MSSHVICEPAPAFTYLPADEKTSQDLWGRGYSDSCADLEHDDRLYATEILLALTSSPLSWTGGGSNGGFTLLGYSLGGGIAACFASYFPAMVRSLVLIAPSGIIRPQHMSSRNRFLYSMGLVPEAVVNWIVTRRLKAGPMYKDENQALDEKATVGAVISAEVEGHAA
jgi:pimeloyl-ACP methyl ester carboxylesterase